jgi:hypothetical protein
MTLEALLVSLGLTEHMAPLSAWRDDLLREKAAELQAVRLAADEAIAAGEVAFVKRMEVLDATRSETIARLEADLAAALAPPATPPILTQLGQAFAALPAPVQAAFAASYAIVRTLVEAGRTDLARAHVASLDVPEGLDATRQGILALLA